MTRNTSYITICIPIYIYNVWCKNPFFPNFFSSISILQAKMLFIPAEVSSRHLQVLPIVTHLLRFSVENGCTREYVKGLANKTITIYYYNSMCIDSSEWRFRHVQRPRHSGILFVFTKKKKLIQRNLRLTRIGTWESTMQILYCYIVSKIQYRYQ